MKFCQADEMHHPPLVSVIITNYNYGKYVSQAIKSVANQTYEHFECLVVDDASTDGSFGIINSVLDEIADRRFRALRLERNLGQMAAFKVGIENAAGSFVAFLDADDKWRPNFLEVHVITHLNSAFSCALTASDTIQIDENNAVLEGTHHKLKKYRFSFEADQLKVLVRGSVALYKDHKIIINDYLHGNLWYVERTSDDWIFVNTSSLMFRRDVIDLIVPEETESTRICADYYVAMFAHSIGGTICIPSSLSYYRMHRQNNFARHPLLGGPYLLGSFSDTTQQAIREEISKHVFKRFALFVRLFGLEWASYLLAFGGDHFKDLLLTSSGSTLHRLIKAKSAAPGLRYRKTGAAAMQLLPIAASYNGVLGTKDEELTFRKVKGVELVEAPDGRLIYDKTRERVILLNLTASAVFELCDGETDAAKIAVLMQDAFQLSEPPQSDVEDCLRSLVSEGLVETSSGKSLIFRFKKRFLQAIR